MRISWSLLLASVWISWLAVTAFAATYYVAPSGDDGGAGTEVQPWLTIQRAVDAADPGDIILVKPGTYQGCRVERSGRPDAVCTLRGEGRVLVDSPGPRCRRKSNLELARSDGQVSYWVIEGIESADSPRYGIDLGRGDHLVVRNCLVHHARVTGIVTSFTDHVVIEGNECHHNGEHGIYHANSGDHPIIRGNRSYSNHGCGIHMNGDLNMGGDGLISHALVEMNVIWGNSVGGGSAINCDGVSDSIIRNNLCYSNLASGVSLYAIDGAEGSSRNQVLNNTILVPANGRWALNIPASHDGKLNPTGNVAVNNILLSANPRTGAITIWGAEALKASDHNTVPDHLSANGGSSVISLSEWQALGYDAHSRVCSPGELFANTEEHDYHLRPGSPAIDAGAARPEVQEDLDGLRRPQGKASDIGCYEAPSRR